MKTREETKRYLNNALSELSDPGAVGHYMRCNRYASMLEEAFGVKGPVELTDKLIRLLDQVPEGFTWAISKDGMPVALGSRVWLGDQEMRVVAVSHRRRIAIREWPKERGGGDVDKLLNEYWGCEDIGCDECPAIVDGQMPFERYGVDNCLTAQTLDLLRRQRALDAKGAE